MAHTGTYQKYAALVTNWTYGTRRQIQCNADLRCGWWDLRHVGDKQSQDMWREAFGTFEYDKLRSERLTMFVFGRDTTDTSNAVNDRLVNRVGVTRFAFLLNRPPINAGGTLWIVSGDVDENGTPSSVRVWHRLDELYNPYYINRPAFDVEMNQFADNAWVDGWCTEAAVLDAAFGAQWIVSPALEVAVLSFWDASLNRHVDFRIPSLVRTIEALIAIPRGGGAATFAQRASLFAASVQQHPQFAATGLTMDAHLQNLFQLRSDAVHGKWPMRERQLANRHDEVALFDFTAEAIARAAIKWAIRNRASIAQYQTRNDLEAAWRANAVPPP